MMTHNRKYVSRSAFQKLAEKNKRLMKDIEVMACGECFEAIQMRIKWRKYFEQQKELENAIRDFILKGLK